MTVFGVGPVAAATAASPVVCQVTTIILSILNYINFLFSFVQRSSLSPGDQVVRERQAMGGARSPEPKKVKREQQPSDGEKSDQDLVVDDPNDAPAATTANGNHHSPKENGGGSMEGKKSPRSPGSEGSSSGKKREDSGKKGSQPAATTPTSKPLGTGPPLPSKCCGSFETFRLLD